MATYSFMDVSASLVGIGGNISLGYGSANAKEGISIVFANDKNNMTIGADGEGMNTLRADKSGQITVRLLKTSPTNAKLQVMYDLQSLSSSAWGNNVIVVRNTASGDITTARDVSFKKNPDLNYAEDGDLVEWVFDAVKIDKLLGTY